MGTRHASWTGRHYFCPICSCDSCILYMHLQISSSTNSGVKRRIQTFDSELTAFSDNNNNNKQQKKLFGLNTVTVVRLTLLEEGMSVSYVLAEHALTNTCYMPRRSNAKRESGSSLRSLHTKPYEKLKDSRRSPSPSSYFGGRQWYETAFILLTVWRVTEWGWMQSQDPNLGRGPTQRAVAFH